MKHNTTALSPDCEAMATQDNINDCYESVAITNDDVTEDYYALGHKSRKVALPKVNGVTEDYAYANMNRRELN